MRIRYSAFLTILSLGSFAQADLKPGFTPNVPVTAPTRLDWVFTVANRSSASPTASLLDPKFDSTKQSFDVYLPPRKDLKAPIPAILFVSAGNEAAGWKSFEPICTKLGIAYIAVRGAGNNVPTPKRCRIVLDCLDEVRRQVPLDPDRTYITGFSGGGRIACSIAFALPEQFGGMIPLCAGGDLREEPWLRRRAVDRLSAALITGSTDFNRGEIEQWKGPLWNELGLRSRVWVQAGMGHAIPNATTLGEAIAWLEDDRTRRAALAKTSPASRADVAKPLTSEEFAAVLLKEAKEKIADAKTRYAGLMLAKGVSERWTEEPSGKAARKMLLDFEAKKDLSWEKDDLADQRTMLIAEARSLSNYALKGVPAGSPYLKFRPDMAKKAISLWQQVIEDSPSSDAAKEGKTLLPRLEELIKK